MMTQQPADRVDDAPTTPTERTRPQLRMTRVGVVAAALAVALCALAFGSYPGDAGSDVGFPIATLAVSVVLLAICVLQLTFWMRGLRRGHLGEPIPAGPDARVSWWAHLLSYPVLLAGIYLSIEASALGGFSELPGFCLGLAAISMLVAQVTGAVQYLRADGPPGTIPNHVRHLLAWIQTQR